MVKDPGVRELLELWAVKNIISFSIEARASGEHSAALAYQQRASLMKLLEDIIDQAGTYEEKEWHQGDQKLGTILTRRLWVILK